MYHLERDDGCFPAHAAAGEVTGYDVDSGANYGGSRGAPLPPGALSVFIMTEGEWQTATGKNEEAQEANGRPRFDMG